MSTIYMYLYNGITINDKSMIIFTAYTLLKVNMTGYACM